MHTFFVDDFAPWEKEYLLPFASRLTDSLGGTFEVVSVPTIPLKVRGDSAWVVARRWKRAVARLKSQRGQRVLISVFDSREPKGSVYQMLWRSVASPVRKDFSLVTHHPLTYRYFTEIEKLMPGVVVSAPLSYPHFPASPAVSEAFSFSVGVLSHLDEEANLNFIVAAAHRLLLADEKVIFKVYGDGPFRSHLTEMAKRLELSPRFEIIPTFSIRDLRSLGACAYLPVKGDSFISLLITVGLGIPTVCVQTPGLDDILNSLSVPAIHSHDTEGLAQALESILRNPPARHHQQQTMQAGLSQKFGWEQIVPVYENIFGIQGPSISKAEAAA